MQKSIERLKRMHFDSKFWHYAEDRHVGGTDAPSTKSPEPLPTVLCPKIDIVTLSARINDPTVINIANFSLKINF